MQVLPEEQATQDPRENAVVGLSGGQDSTTCLYWAKRRFERVEAISIDYGQRHGVELDAAMMAAREAKVPHRILDLGVLSDLGGAALTDDTIPAQLDATDTGASFAAEHGLPSTFVPGRNVLFLGLLAAYGLPRGLANIVVGVCQQDRQGYPDCRAEFVVSMEHTLALALDDSRVKIHAPLMHKDKADTWALAAELGCLDAVLASRTCYYGAGKQHSWGRGCGECPACEERANGWRVWNERLSVAGAR